MKVAFLGNMNNYTFPVALEMESLGADVRFFVDSTYGLHRPEQRYPLDIVRYGHFSFDIAPLRIRDIVFPTRKHRMVSRLLADYPLVVSTAYGIPLGAALEKTMYVMASGSDLYELANERSLAKTVAKLPGFANAAARFNLRRLHRLTRRGLREAVGVDAFVPGIMPASDATLDNLSIPKERRSYFTPTDLNLARFVPLPRRDELVIVSGARQSWCKPLPAGMGPLDDKGNDVLIRGLALFASSSSQPFRARLPKKGPDFEASRELAEQLGIGSRIEWFPEIPQSMFLEEMRDADIVADQFGPGTFGMAVRDALAIGRPVIARADVEQISIAVGDELPIISADSPQAIADGLMRLSDRAEREKLAEAGRSFSQRHFSARSAASAIIGVLSQAASNK